VPKRNLPFMLYSCSLVVSVNRKSCSVPKNRPQEKIPGPVSGRSALAG
jgi:hypothetical protein